MKTLLSRAALAAAAMAFGLSGAQAYTYNNQCQSFRQLSNNFGSATVSASTITLALRMG